MSSRTEPEPHEQALQTFFWYKSMPCPAGPQTESCQEIRLGQGKFLLELLILKHVANPHELQWPPYLVVCLGLSRKTNLKSSDRDLEHHFPRALISNLNLLHLDQSFRLITGYSPAVKKWYRKGRH